MKNSPNKEVVPSPFAGKFDYTRLIMFLEDSPQSNTYHQILLTPNQYRLISDLLFKLFTVCRVEEKEIVYEKTKFVLARKAIKLPENIEDFHEQDQIPKLI